MFTAINPIIDNLEPPAAEPGAQVVINGSGFGQYSPSYSQVLFNGATGAGIVPGAIQRSRLKSAGAQPPAR